MKIEKITAYKLNIRRVYPWRTSLGVQENAHNILINILTDSGLEGWGEASPRTPITGDTQETGCATARDLAKLIKGRDPLSIENITQEIKAFTTGDPSIRSAFDMALYDIAAKAANMPLYKFLGGDRREIKTDMTIGMMDTVQETVNKAENIISQGFDSIKIKIGRRGLKDVDHVKAVRECVGSSIKIRVDSNQGWDYPEAKLNLQAMESLCLQFSEQPLAAQDHENIKRLRNDLALPICVDESVFDHKDALKIVAMGAADYLNIKLGKAGGINTALKINTIAESAGCKCMIGCFAESRLGLTAAAHMAVARPNIEFLDLDSALFLREDPIIGGMTYDKKIGGLIHLSENPGLGVDVEKSFLREFIQL